MGCKKRISLSHQYATAGAYDVTVVVRDEAQNTGMTMSTVTVNAVPEIATLDAQTVNEGQIYMINGSFTDNDSTSWTATVNYGDGSGAQPLILSGTNFSLSHTYQNDGNYTVVVTVTDAQGASGTENVAITVVNVAPSVTAITASLNPIAINTAMTASASFTDAGVLDTHTAVWNWGDGTTSVGTVSENNGTGAVLNSHSYVTAGVYEITLTVTDDDNGVGSNLYQYQTVYDANAGWAAGSKEFDSPAGSIVGNTSLPGKASFGFQVKYQQGDMVPSGKNVEFSFPAGNIDFTSSSYQWLVVSGTKATFKATGTLNGLPGYTILVSAIDQGNGQQNGLIRIQLKNPSNTIVYDTQSGAADTVNPVTPVSKGKIAVH